MTDSNDRLHRWIFWLTAGFLYAAAALRSALELADDPFLTEALLLLLAWLALFVLENLVSARWGSASRPSPTPERSRTSSWGPFFPLYLAAQTAIVVVLLARGEDGDYYAVLFGILSMQAMLRLGWKSAVIWIALFLPLTALPLTLAYDVPQAIAFAFIYLAADVLLAFFTFITRRAAEARARNHGLMGELQVTNREIEAYSRQIERLAATNERHRLARELHDSVTQTVFSMNLTAQSAALLLPRNRSAAAAQLVRLEELTQGALAEIGILGSELAPAGLGEGGLAPALRRHLEERGLLGESDLPDQLTVTLAVDGAEGSEGVLSATEELCLFRVAQEALNNIVKHAQTSQARIRLRLSPPCRIEIEDHGRGFIPEVGEGAKPGEGAEPGEGAGRMGLASMSERAAEIGWMLRIVSAPGEGTRIVVEQPKGRVVEQ